MEGVQNFHATDLIRDFIFMLADREGVDRAILYDSVWSQFEVPFWTEDQWRGALVQTPVGMVRSNCFAGRIGR